MNNRTYSDDYTQPFQMRTIGTDDGVSPVGIMMHGFGSNMDDLYGVAMPLSDKVPYWILPQAPIDMIDILAYHAYAWFPDTELELQHALMGTLWSNIADIDMDSIQVAAKKVIDEIIVSLKGYDNRNIILAGFSQGAMMASEVVLQSMLQGISIHKAILMSSCLLASERWNDIASRLQSSDSIQFPAVFQSHGRLDAVLSQYNTLADFWNTYSTHKLYLFDGGHEVPLDVIQQVQNFL